MTDIPSILYVLVLIAVVILAGAFAPKLLKKQLTPLLSIIEGRVYLKFRGVMFPVLEGTWHGEKVKVEVKHLQRINNLFITLFSSRPLPFSFKLRPTAGVFGLFDMPMGALADGHRFKIPEANITVYSSASDETMIRQFLNPDRLSVIKDIFSRDFNFFEVHTDPIAGDYLKVGIEGCRFHFWGSISASKTALYPEEVNYILLKLSKFHTASPNTDNSELILSSLPSR